MLLQRFAHAALRNVPRTTGRVVSGHRVFIHLGGIGHRHSSAASACRGSHRGPLDRRVGLSLVYFARVVVLADPTLPFRSAVVAIVALAGLHSPRRAVRHMYRCFIFCRGPTSIHLSALSHGTFSRQ